MSVSVDVVAKVLGTMNVSISEVSRMTGWNYFKAYRLVNDKPIKSDDFMYFLDCLGFDFDYTGEGGEKISLLCMGNRDNGFKGTTMNVVMDLVNGQHMKKIEIARAAKMTANLLLHKIERDSFKADELITLLESLKRNVIIHSRSTGEVVYSTSAVNTDSAEDRTGMAASIIKKCIAAKKTTQVETASKVGWTKEQLYQRFRRNSILVDEFLKLLLANDIKIAIYDNDKIVVDVSEKFIIGEYACNEMLMDILKYKGETKASLCKKIGWDDFQLNRRIKSNTIRTDIFFNMLAAIGLKMTFELGADGARTFVAQSE